MHQSHTRPGWLLARSGSMEPGRDAPDNGSTAAGATAAALAVALRHRVAAAAAARAGAAGAGARGGRPGWGAPAGSCPRSRGPLQLELGGGSSAGLAGSSGPCPGGGGPGLRRSRAQRRLGRLGLSSSRWLPCSRQVLAACGGPCSPWVPWPLCWHCWPLPSQRAACPEHPLQTGASGDCWYVIYLADPVTEVGTEAVMEQASLLAGAWWRSRSTATDLSCSSASPGKGIERVLMSGCICQMCWWPCT